MNMDNCSIGDISENEERLVEITRDALIGLNKNKMENSLGHFEEDLESINQIKDQKRPKRLRCKDDLIEVCRVIIFILPSHFSHY
jgi:hypothetical protein